VIAKSHRSWDGEAYDPDSNEDRSPAGRLFNDWAGLEFLTRVMGEDSPAPAFIAGDRKTGYFIMEDIHVGLDPAQALLGQDPQLARGLMLAIAVELGRMHAATAGRLEEYKPLRLALGRQGDHEVQRVSKLVSSWISSLDSLDLSLDRGATDDLERVRQTVLHPGPFLAHVHGDPCPDNWWQVAGRMRLFDFELGGFRHALQDGVYGRIHFPTCWCVNRFPEDLPEAMENAYRSELVLGCPQAGEDGVFYPAVVELCAFWFLVTCQWRNGLAALMKEDGQWGIATLRQRVLVRGQVLVELTSQFHHLEALGASVARLLELLRNRWPEEADQMPLYPAFR
jgi:hypothetical protein